MDPEREAARNAERRACALLEAELVCAPDLRAALLDEIAGRIGVSLAPPGRLAAGPPREGVDLILTTGERPVRIALLCALRATPAVRDAESAAASAAALLEDRDADFAFTILLGGCDDPPAEIVERFACALPLTDLAAMIGARAAALTGAAGGELADRIAHAAAALAETSARARRAAAAASAQGAERFRDEYLALLGDVAPGLPPPDPPPQPGAPLDTVAFGADALPRWPFMPPLRLSHHLREGAASIRLGGWGDDLDGLAAVMEPSLRDTDYLLSASPGATPGAAHDALIVALTPRLDPSRPLDPQYDAARECVRILRETQRWFMSRRAAARYWAEFAAPHGGGVSRVRREMRLR